MYHIIINPASRSGRGRKIWRALIPILEKNRIRYYAYFTKYCGHATFIIDGIFAMNPSVQGLQFIVLGGDGTLNEVIQAIHQYKHTTIGYIPTGSSNDFARDLGIAPTPTEALMNILQKHAVKSLNIGLLTYLNGNDISSGQTVLNSSSERRLFSVSSGIGFDAAVCKKAMDSTMKDILNHIGLGKLTYLGIALTKLLTLKPVSCDIYLDDREPIHYDRLLFATAMIHKYEGGGFMFCPQADATDHLLDLCVAHHVSNRRALHILPSAFLGEHTKCPEVAIHRAHTIRLCTDTPLFVHTDGEVTTYAKEILWQSFSENLNFIY